MVRHSETSKSRRKPLPPLGLRAQREKTVLRGGVRAGAGGTDHSKADVVM